jgi:LEA14-like dessication related protein
MTCRRTPHAHLAAMLCVAPLLSGCALLGRAGFRAPAADLKSLRVNGLGLSGGSLNLILDVHNPNALELRGLAVQGTLTLEDTDFGAAELERATLLPPKAHTEVEVPMQFAWEGVGAAARGLLNQGSVRYRLGGRFLVETPLGGQWVGIARAGAVGVGDVM